MPSGAPGANVTEAPDVGAGAVALDRDPSRGRRAERLRALLGEPALSGPRAARTARAG
jgi:hypothetical protein